MMEKFLDQYDDWVEYHHDTWVGRNVPGPDWLGAGTSAQLDLMSPTGIYDWTRDPSMFNFAKAAYNPLIAYAGYSWIQALTGSSIQFGARIAHTAELTGHTLKAVGGSVVRGVRTLTPGAIFAAGLVGASLWLQDLYHDMSGMYIGDIRFSR